MEVKFLLEYFINNILCMLVRETFERKRIVKLKIKWKIMRLTQIFFLKNQDIFSIIERLLKYKLNKKFLKQTSLSIKVPNKEKKWQIIKI